MTKSKQTLAEKKLGPSKEALTPSDESRKPLTESANSKKKPLILLTSAILLIALCWLLLWLFHFRFYQSTDDAYVNGNLVKVTPAISGTPIAFFADDTDLVEAGQLLVLLDPTLYKIQYEQELAKLSSAALQVMQMYDTVKVCQSTVENKKVQLQRAQYDFLNRKNLVDLKAVTNEDYVHSRDAFMTAKLDYQQALDQLQVALDAAGNTPREEHPILLAQKKAVRQAYYHLKHCSIYAPCRGHIAKRTVEVGQTVTPQSNLMAIIPQDYMWVDANFKETELTHMRVGQPATVTFDIYGKGVEFEGKVLGIGSGTGSVFSLIPPQNATGNWIKIVQRLPVRIGLDVEKMKKFPLRLGLSAFVTVDIANTSLPMLVEEIKAQPVGVTGVFELDFTELNARMDEMIHSIFTTVSQVDCHEG
ncbi:HlyD family efflux transporter periplasmic adaptor subunit [Parachlamydia sp. AcF125]|uniref:HlyD family secretion protein n=1 Tax=Parachlamydia sp. AcF125 TaxID=2795736 RepID=UPI001BC92E65|nr:HlyD family efflux transporter periplasmic adaptor subunit [Parachlamydia sp. AcF125]MBS4167661.1 Multidrug export protein EmrA [Parachlamydia sp. AcF125]